MKTYRITIRFDAETKKKAVLEVNLRIPQGEVCKIRLDNKRNGGKG